MSSDLSMYVHENPCVFSVTNGVIGSELYVSKSRVPTLDGHASNKFIFINGCFALFVIVIVEYIFFGFNHIEPNYIVMSALAILFGSGIGKQFCEFETENTIIKRINEKKLYL